MRDRNYRREMEDRYKEKKFRQEKFSDKTRSKKSWKDYRNVTVKFLNTEDVLERYELA